MIRARRPSMLAAMAVVTLLPLGCNELRVLRIASDLDDVGEMLDDYGSVAVSSPLLADVRKLQTGRFGFELETGPNEYYRDAKKQVQGIGAIFSQRATEFRGGFQLRANLENLLTNQIRLDRFRADQRRFKQRSALTDAGTLMGLLLPMINPQLALSGALDDLLKTPTAADDDDTANVGDKDVPIVKPPDDEPLTEEQERFVRFSRMIAALSATGAGLSGATSQPAVPEFDHDLPDIDDKVLAKNDLVEQLVVDKKFARFRALLGQMPTSQPVVSNRSAIITAAGDSMVESIMSYLGSPISRNADGTINDWSDKVVLMGVSMVSVAPGRYTRRGYVADVAVTCRLDWRPARFDLIKPMSVYESPYLKSLFAMAAKLDKNGTWGSILVECGNVAKAKRIVDVSKSRIIELAEEATATGLTRESIDGQLEEQLASDTALYSFLGKDEAERIGRLPVEQARNQLRRITNIPKPGELRRSDDDSEAFLRTLLGVEMPPDISKLREQLEENLVALDVAIGALRNAQVEDPNRIGHFATIDDIKIFEVQPYSGKPVAIDLHGLVSNPVVSAASPMTEAQTLDLASSIRQQQAFAFKLAMVVAGFGAEAQAQGLLKSIDRLEQDIQTRTPLNTVAAYSNAGGSFGYQIGPSLMGMADFIPTRRVGGALGLIKSLIAGEVRPGPDMILQRQSFPVALFIGLNRHDLRIRLAKVKVYPKRGGKEKPRDLYILVEPVLKFEQTTRWIPMERPQTDDRLPARRKRIHDRDRVLWAWELADAKRLARKLKPKLGNDWEYILEFKDYVDARADLLRSQALVAASYQTLPSELISSPMYEKEDPIKVPQVHEHVPAVIRIDPGKKWTPAYVALTGKDLKTVKTVEPVSDDGRLTIPKHTRGPNKGEPRVEIGDDAILVQVWIKNDKDRKDDFVFHLKLNYELHGENRFVLSPPFRVMPPASAKKGGTAARDKDKSIKISRERKWFWPFAGKDTLEIPFGIPIELVRAFLLGPNAASSQSKRGASASVSVKDAKASATVE